MGEKIDWAMLHRFVQLVSTLSKLHPKNHSFKPAIKKADGQVQSLLRVSMQLNVRKFGLEPYPNYSGQTSRLMVQTGKAAPKEMATKGE